MIAIIGLFIILIISLTVVRFGAIILELTGLSPDVASFQAQSAFSGAGFTTSESETIVSHPVRRKVIRTLILLGSVGITSTIATLIVAIMGFSTETVTDKIAVLALGLFTIYLLARSKIIYKLMKRILVKAFSKSKSLQIQDYHELLGIGQGYSISQYVVDKNNWAVGHIIQDMELNKEGTLVLSIHRSEKGKERFLVPKADTKIQVKDRLTLYGRKAACQCLANRPQGSKGEAAHQARIEQERSLREVEAAAEGLS